MTVATIQSVTDIGQGNYQVIVLINLFPYIAIISKTTYLTFPDNTSKLAYLSSIFSGMRANGTIGERITNFDGLTFNVTP